MERQPVVEWISRGMPVMMCLLLLLLVGSGAGAPTGREVYRIPQSALKALSDRGTVVLEAAVSRALAAVELAVSERSRAEAGCRGCVPCLFQDCGQRSGACSSPAAEESEPSCEVIGRAQKLSDEGARSWALSQACGYYRLRCPHGLTDTENCVRIMGESCSARVLQCSLLNTMQNLEPATQTSTQAVCGQRVSAAQNQTQPRSRIVGGSPAPSGSWPWLVNLQLDGALMCGGVLVDSSWVVTAAHCFAGSRSESYWTAVVGEFDITKSDPDEQVMKVNRIITHPKFNPKTFNNDIALVELSSPVVLSERVTPVCLPSDREPPVGTPCLVAGWGSLYEDGPSADVVMEAKVPLLSQGTCKSALGKELVTNTMFCAGYLSGGIDSCQGDSGGPLIFQDRMSGRFQLIGITSWGDGCGEKGKPGVYTRVTAFSDWILSEIQKSFGSREPTCPELLKTTELTEEQQRSEFTSICRYYTLSCPSTLDSSACTRLAQDKCQNRFKKCQLRSFLQTLLDLLQRADDYIRDKVDLTFFTQTLPQLVEHIYSTALSSTRERREAPSESIPHLPALFEEVGPLLDDWGNYLRDMSDDPDQKSDSDTAKHHHPEEHLFLQDEAPALRRLDEELRSAITVLRSRLESRLIPTIPELDQHFLQRDFTIPTFPHPVTSNPSTLLFDQFHTSEQTAPTSTPLSTLGNEVQTGSAKKSLLTVTREVLQNMQELATLKSLPSANTPQPLSDVTSNWLPEGRLTGASPAPTLPPFLWPVFNSPASKRTNKRVQRRRRGLNKRQLLGTGNKVCPGAAETARQVSVTKEMYHWILDIPPHNLSMNFQEILVDLTSKNERGLYEARVKAIAGGRPMTFYSLVGLENESFYRSMPRIIALALDGLKT